MTPEPAGTRIPLHPPPAVLWIVRTLEKAGHETWAVGGAVRDALAGVASGDWDLATHARPGEMRKIFRRTVPIGIEHGTVGVLARDGTLFEVTTFRQDVETTGRHATVRFAETLEEDLARRDFTINAVAWHPLRDELRDPFGGATDLSEGVLRTVGDPRERFSEDYLRILRALRFAGTFGLTIDESTWSALRDGVGRMDLLSPERVREELMKVLSKDARPSVALGLYAESGVLNQLYPELSTLRDAERGAAGGWEEALRIVDALAARRPLLRLAALLRDVGVPATLALMERLRYSNAAIQEVAGLVSASGGRRLPLPPEDAPAADIRRWLSLVEPARFPALVRLAVAGVRALDDRGDPAEGPGSRRGAECEVEREAEVLLLRWRRVRAELRSTPPLRVEDLALDGRDLIRMGYKPGPHFGRVLRELLEVVLDDPSRNDAETLAGVVRDRLEDESGRNLPGRSRRGEG